MPEAVLDPFGPEAAHATDADLRRRIEALEARLQAVPALAVPATPYLPGTVDASWRQAVTDPTFGAGNTSPWVFVVPRVARSACRCEIPWATDGATTGEVQLTAASGTLLTTAVALAAGSSGTVTYNWIHGRNVWSGHVNFDVWARRSGGAGNVYIGYPRFFLVDPAGCTTTGI